MLAADLTVIPTTPASAAMMRTVEMAQSLDRPYVVLPNNGIFRSRAVGRTVTALRDAGIASIAPVHRRVDAMLVDGGIASERAPASRAAAELAAAWVTVTVYFFRDLSWFCMARIARVVVPGIPHLSPSVGLLEPASGSNGWNANSAAPWHPANAVRKQRRIRHRRVAACLVSRRGKRKDKSAEQFAVRAEPSEPQSLVVWFAVDEEQVGFDMALPVALPISGQRMIPVFLVTVTVYFFSGSVMVLNGLHRPSCRSRHSPPVTQRGPVGTDRTAGTPIRPPPGILQTRPQSNGGPDTEG